ncbi:MAG: universal stress protein [Gammaproteobacteria bacterium]|uniref:universal stress protein n=1 Tax=Pseudomaricurvus alcaniphilus TaxID=1166482 RepID=UPI0014080F42|nr:universal stress protein [Pseudomaricurvus alcaniphilus]MBR9912665.1 universal stress protein [Gammaproteobacteria bacterium]NHN35974.1 universal stress protein [Pseudomaricurvus alcaniphilus]
MSNYTHILVGVDLSDEANHVIQRANALAAASKAKLSIVHVVEPLTFAYGGDIPVDLTEIQDQLQTKAVEQLRSMAKANNISSENQHVVTGQPVSEIHALADELNVDLVIVGSHGRKGLALLLGSTANGVLHGAKCDVLAVRVKD